MYALHSTLLQAILKSSSTIKDERSNVLSHDESTVFEILPGKIGKLSGENVRSIRNKKDKLCTYTQHLALDSVVSLCVKIHHIG